MYTFQYLIIIRVGATSILNYNNYNNRKTTNN